MVQKRTFNFVNIFILRSFGQPKYHGSFSYLNYLTKLYTSAAVAHKIQRWRPCTDAHHVWNHNQHTSTHSWFGRKTNLSTVQTYSTVVFHIKFRQSVRTADTSRYIKRYCINKCKTHQLLWKALVKY